MLVNIKPYPILLSGTYSDNHLSLKRRRKKLEFQNVKLLFEVHIFIIMKTNKRDKASTLMVVVFL